jgi:bifunctional non-homologous end joining protein LigD
MSLSTYRKKRDLARTPEPAGEKAVSRRGHSFVVQKHQARRLHYDFRLEMHGVLLSWAVPKGPSLDPRQKRLAVQTEDHPLDYGKFEGVIPEGEYGAGPVMVWDYGRWEPEGDAERGYRTGKLKFNLHGKKLRGAWTLVRSGSSRRRADKPEWLLIKKQDAEAELSPKKEIVDASPRSALSDRTIEEIAAGKPRRQNKTATAKASKRPRAAPRQREVRRLTKRGRERSSLAKLPGARRAALPKRFVAQLATAVSEAPEGNDWLHELKFDGYRMFCRLQRRAVRFISRTGQDWTARLEGLVSAASQLPAREALLDGEVVVLDSHGVSSFQALQNAFSGQSRGRFVYFAFDLLHLDGYDLTAVALEKRKEVLESLLRAAPASSKQFRFSEHIVGSGGEFFKQVCASRLEGMISKRRDAPYYPGRSRSWVKTKCREGQEFVIGGFTKPGGSRIGFGSLLLGYYRANDKSDGGKFVYAGRVGTGFNQLLLAELLQRLKALEQSKSPFVNFASRRTLRGVHWVRPELVAQVEFSNWTHEGLLRQASFQGLREDKPAREVTREMPVNSE